MTYENIAEEPINQDTRQIIITLPSNLTSPCSIALSVINVADNPIVNFIPNHTVYYLEDNPESVFLFNSTLLSISDQDNSFLAQATILITNQPIGIEDKLFIPGFSEFTILGNGTHQIEVTSLADQLPHQSFINIVNEISFSSNDQAP